MISAGLNIIPHQVTAQTLTAQECQILADPEFQADYAHMRITTEGCQKLSDCQSEPGKWTQEIKLTLFLGKLFAFSTADTIYKTLLQFDKNFFATTGIKTEVNLPISSSDDESGTLGNVILFFLDDEVDSFIRETGIYHPIDRYDFMKNNAPSCFGSVYRGDNGEIFHANLAIQASVPHNKILKCVLEEMFNSTGITGDPEGYGGTFDKYPPKYDGKVPELNDALWLMINLHYNYFEQNADEVYEAQCADVE